MGRDGDDRLSAPPVAGGCGCDLPHETEVDLGDIVKDSPPLAEANEIYRKLEERAIAESNDLNHRVAHCRKCRRGDFLPTVGSGHPLADILLVKYQPHYLEVTEGVAFFGRSGTAVLKSMERLGVNPLIVYGTNLVKCHDVDTGGRREELPAVYWLEEFHITQPRIVVVMGRQTLDAVNRDRVAGMKEAGLGSRRSRRTSPPSARLWSRRISTGHWTRSRPRPNSGRRFGTWASGSGRAPYSPRPDMSRAWERA